MERSHFILSSIIFLLSYLKLISATLPVPQLSRQNQYVCTIPTDFEDTEDSLQILGPPMLRIDNFYQEISLKNSFEVQCTGQKPLIWVINNYGREYNTAVLNITETRYRTNISSTLYKSNLVINDPSYLDTRLYACLYDKHDKWTEINSFYLFVNDPENVFLPSPSEIIYCGSNLLIPCRSTYSKANMTLWKVLGEDNFLHVPVETSKVSYQPTDGFKILHKSYFYDGEFICQAEVEGRKYTNVIYSYSNVVCALLAVLRKKPLFRIENVRYVSSNKFHKITCSVDTYEGDDIWLEFRKCNDSRCDSRCSTYDSAIVLARKDRFKKSPKSDEIFEFEIIKEVKIIESGEYRCVCGLNNLEIASESLSFTVTDIEAGFGIVPLKSNAVEGDNIAIECRANIFHYSSITFSRFSPPSTHLEADSVETLQGYTKYSLSSSITIYNITKNFNETLICTAKMFDSNEVKQNNVTLIALSAFKPQFTSERYKQKINISNQFSQPVLNCSSIGLPVPVTKWFKGEKEINITSNSTVEIFGDGQFLRIRVLKKKEVEGQYRCEVTNRLGSIGRSFTVYFEEQVAKETIVWAVALAVALAVGLAILVVVLICCLRTFHQKRAGKAELKALFEELNNLNQLDKVDPNRPLDEQVEYLPYDKKWEFNEKRLKFGEILGQGAFGKVVKAEAIGVTGDETDIVAVKTTKDRANISQMKLLISELKILIHLGRHLNIANLMGAVTKNIVNGELMIIVEYCRFGNLRNFLIEAKNKFVNLINPETGLIDLKMNKEEDTTSQDVQNEKIDIDGGLISSVNPYIDVETKPLSSTDLLSYSYQVARGMNFLASKKILHRDLAARNVLLSGKNIVKICDFGLAKDVYQNNYYKLQGNGPLPIKWIALESLEKKIFTVQSDVWSYGIFIWELFSLGGDPYPGMNIDEVFFNKLQSGYRMEQPQYAPKKIYNIMLQCWAQAPEDRPTFEKLENLFGDIIQVTHHDAYMQLETEYVKMSQVENCFESTLLEKQENDMGYLKMGKGAQGYGELTSGSSSIDGSKTEPEAKDEIEMVSFNKTDNEIKMGKK